MRKKCLHSRVRYGKIISLRKATFRYAPACRNGRRGRLKICCGQPRMGSSPIAGTPWQGQSFVFDEYKACFHIWGFLPLVKSAGGRVRVFILQCLWYDSKRENADFKKPVFPGIEGKPGAVPDLFRIKGLHGKEFIYRGKTERGAGVRQGFEEECFPQGRIHGG